VSRVLVTGATGFIGRHVVEPLRAAGHEVRAVGSRDGDLLEPRVIEGLVEEARADALLHLAWYAEPGAFWTSDRNLRWVGASLDLLHAFAAAGGRRAVVAGTCAEYDWSHAFLSERETPLAPSTLYGECKVSLHRVAQRWGGLSLAWGRVFFLYGPGEHPARLVSSVASALVRGQPAPCSSGEQVRDFLHVADVGRAFAALVDSDVEGPVNVASGEGVSVREVVTTLGELAGRPELVRLGAVPPRPGEPPELVGDIGRLRDEVGFTPAIGLREGLERTVSWWREHSRQT
jgi:nucleoside-diphosphate-sugar epimerase